MKPRIETIADGITREAISEHTHLLYDPATKAASVSFQYRPSLYVNDEWSGFAGDYAVLTKSVTELAELRFGEGLIDPVTEASLANVSGAGLVLLIKAAFPMLYDAAFASEPAATDE